MTAEQAQWKLLIFTEITVKPYTLHNVPALALPPGLTYRFRYRRDLFDLGQSQLADIEGKSGLLVLRDQNAPDFTPAREFTIHEVNEQGDIVFMELAFDKYVAHDNGPGQYDQVILDALAHSKIKTQKNASLDSYVVRVPPGKLAPIRMQPSTTARDYAIAWLALVRILADKRDFEGVRFFRVVGFSALASHRTLDPQTLGENRLGYEVTGGTTYSLDLMHIAPSGTTPDPHDMRLDGSEQFFQFPKKEERVDGRYDLISLMLYVIPQPAPKQSAVLLLSTAQKIDKRPIPPIFVPLDIKWPIKTWLWRLIPLFFIVVGFLMIFSADCLASLTSVQGAAWTVLGSLLIGSGLTGLYQFTS